MNVMTEEEYELELHGVSQEDEINSEDERDEIEAVLYQAMHYAESIAANKSIHETKDKPVETSMFHQVQKESLPHTTVAPQKLDPPEGVVATEQIDLISHQNSDYIVIDDSENSKYGSMSAHKKSRNLVKHVNDLANKSSDCESDKDVTVLYSYTISKKPNSGNVSPREGAPSNDSNKTNLLNDSNSRTLMNKSHKDRLLKDGDSDDECCIVIESASEDENLQVHFASKEQEVSSPKRPTSKVTRYFEEPSSKNIIKGKCFNCNQTGHYISDCPENKNVACIMCGLQGHYYKQCPNQLCFNCDAPGHENKSCTKKRIHWTTVCKRCYMPGHEVTTCADKWRQFHLTTNSKPKLLYGAEENMKQTYCYNCGKKGHLGYECKADRMDRYVKVNYPFVCKYRCKKFTCTTYTEPHNEPEMSSNLPMEPDPQEITNSKQKGKKKKTQKSPKIDEEGEKDLQITISKSGKKRKIKCKNKNETDRAEKIEETGTENENNKKRKKSKKSKKVETDAGAEEKKPVDTIAPPSDKIEDHVDDDVIMLETSTKKRKMVDDKDIIVLSSDVDSCTDQTDIIIISDSNTSEEGPKKSKKRKIDKTTVCEDQDVIALSSGQMNTEENGERGNLKKEDNGDDTDPRTPFGLVWGLPNAVCNALKPIPKKIKKMFRKNMKNHNLPRWEGKKQKSNLKQSSSRITSACDADSQGFVSKQQQRNLKQSSSSITSACDAESPGFVSKRQQRNLKQSSNRISSACDADPQGFVSKRQLSKMKWRKRMQKRNKKQGKGKKGVVQTWLNIPSVNVEHSNQAHTSNNFVMSADRSKYKWFKKKKPNLNQTS